MAITRLRSQTLRSKCFDASIKASFIDALTTDNLNFDILNALSKGDALTAQRLIGKQLRSFISLRVYANKSRPENFYEGFMSGMLVSFGDKLGDLKVEQEAGDGYADIKFSFDDDLSAMVIEIKVATNLTQAKAYAQKAIVQIEDKDYAREFMDQDETLNVTAVGLVFYGKKCVIATKKLK